LSAIGLLYKDGDDYILTQISASHLVKGMPGYVGDVGLGVSSDFHWNAIKQLNTVVKQGHSHIEVPKNFRQNQSLSSISCHKHASAVMIDALAPWAKRRKALNVLELFCGNGLLGFAVAQKYANVRLQSMDTTEVLEIAKKNCR